jgi:hypothetical protein
MSPTQPRAWAMGSSRDERIDGSPSRGHVAKWTEKRGVTYLCVKCAGDCEGAALFCDQHLRSVVLRP